MGVVLAHQYTACVYVYWISFPPTFFFYTFTYRMSIGRHFLNIGLIYEQMFSAVFSFVWIDIISQSWHLAEKKNTFRSLAPKIRRLVRGQKSGWDEKKVTMYPSQKHSLLGWIIFELISDWNISWNFGHFDEMRKEQLWKVTHDPKSISNLKLLFSDKAEIKTTNYICQGQ